MDQVLEQLQKIDFTYIPCFEDSIDNIQGFLSLNKKADFLGSNIQSKEILKSWTKKNLYLFQKIPLVQTISQFPIFWSKSWTNSG